MKLISARVKNFNSVVDTREFEIDQVTCLSGKNITGKTNVLRSLARINPIQAAADNFQTSKPSQEARSVADDPAAAVVLIRWILSSKEIRAFERDFGKGCLTSAVITITKDSSETLQWDIPLNTSDEKREKVSLLPAGQRKQNVASFFQSIRQQFLPIEESNHRQTGRSWTTTNAVETITEILQRRLPHFLYCAAFDLIISDIILCDLPKLPYKQDLSKGEQIFLELLTLVQSSPEKAVELGQLSAVIMRLRAYAENICNTIHRYWPHYKDLIIDFYLIKYDSSNHAEPGHKIHLRTRNKQTDGLESIGVDRSGFVWLFSFLIQYHYAFSQCGKNFLILLDEPGATESASAHGALLKFFKNELMPTHQVIYSTHLASMIQSSMFE